MITQNLLFSGGLTLLHHLHIDRKHNFLMSKIKEKGIPIVVVDPMFTDAAATYGTGTGRTPKWIPIRPGGDAYLANAMMYVI